MDTKMDLNWVYRKLLKSIYTLIIIAILLPVQVYSTIIKGLSEVISERLYREVKKLED